LALKPIVNDLKTNFINLNKDRILDVLVEEKIGDYFVGYSKNYIRCYIKSTNDLTNNVVKVTIAETYKDGAIATLI
jgi:hypothetical protein